MKPNIAVIIGGDSSEIVIAEKSGKNILDAIDTQKFTPWVVHIEGRKWRVLQEGEEVAIINKADFSFLLNKVKINLDYAYITIHGTPGEDGVLQGYFEMLKIPYSTSDVHSASLTFNKWFCNQYLKNFGVRVAKSIKLNEGEAILPDKIIKELGIPLFVKPNKGGSSFGISKVKDKAGLEAAIKMAWGESNEALLEEFIEGREITCGLVKLKGRKIVFPLTEIVPNKEFFNYEAKYTPGVASEITPARLPEELAEECRELSSRISDHCNCSGIVRMDYILKDNKFYFLEVNTTPGMTGTSLVPQQIRAMGTTLKEILTLIIEEGLSSRSN